ncbi:MAG: amidohydrolase family protein, partial [Pseudomonadota bacterium]
HVHLVGGPEFPLAEARVEDPAQRPDGGPDFDEWLEMYRGHLKVLGASRGLIVHAILYGADTTVTIEAVKRLGPAFKGVGLLPDGASSSEIAAFAEARMVAVRLNYVHGGVLSWAGAQTMAPVLAAHGLHIQMLLHTYKHMEELAESIATLPTDLVIDHLGWPKLELGIEEPGFQKLLRMLETGKVWVKLSALYRLCPAPFEEAAPFVEALVKANPERLLWGSDWPHLMLADAAMPQVADLLDVFHDAVTSETDRRAILVDNPAQLFRFR